MQIEIQNAGQDLRTLSAVVTFENSRQEPTDIWITSSSHDLAREPGDVFLLAAFLPAWQAGERRIVLNASVDPLVVANLSLVAQTIAVWERRWGPPPAVEADFRANVPVAKGSGLFLSGGVDSVASLRVLTKAFDHQHPLRPSHAILLDYQDINRVSSNETEARFQARRETSRTLAESVGMDFIEIRTNVRALSTSGKFWAHRWHGSVLAAMAHALGQHIHTAHIASTYDWTTLSPWGSHPAIDPFFSGNSLRINHHGLELSRLQKTRQIADWQLALDLINVCVARESGGKNCGVCEKCVRTRLALLACGALAKSHAFTGDNVLPSEIDSVHAASHYAQQCYIDTKEPLINMGRDDLVEAIDRLVRRSNRSRIVRLINRKLLRTR